MNDTDVDTETLLAILSSILHPQEFDEAVLLDALAKSQGDVEAAALSLQSQPPKKRRRLAQNGNIDSWLRGTRAPAQPAAPPMGIEPSGSTSGRQSPPRWHTEANTPDRHSDSPSDQQFVPKAKRTKVTDATSLLQRPATSVISNFKPPVPRTLPLTLATPSLVAEHTPCTMHHSVLPPELACRLYYTLLHSSRHWQRASSHGTSFYRRAPDSTDAEISMQDETEYWYQGRLREIPPTFPAPMEEACQIIEQVVNVEMRKRKRFPLEWGGYRRNEGEEPMLWRANVGAANCYAGAKQNICFHSDQLTHLGPYPTIASLSLGVGRVFRLREVVPQDEKDKRAVRTFNIPLRHNSLVIMHASTQEMFKHAVPPQNTIDMFHPPFPPPSSLSDDPEVLASLQRASNVRINVTFRFSRPDFRSRTIPRCKCGVPCILYPDMKNRYESTVTDVDGDGTQSNASGSRPSASGGSGRKDVVAKYWWACAAGKRNDGKGCGFWKVMDVKAEGRGPFAGNVL